jgi:hypothetical protein
MDGPLLSGPIIIELEQIHQAGAGSSEKKIGACHGMGVDPLITGNVIVLRTRTRMVPIIKPLLGR